MRMARFGGRAERAVDLHGCLFAAALGELSDVRLSRRLRMGWLMTAVGIGQGSFFVVLLLAVALRPAVTKPPNLLASLVFDPAAAAPLVLPKGSPRGSKAARLQLPKRVVQEKSTVEVPVAVPLALAEEPKPTEPQPERSPEDPFGSETGSAGGDPSGAEGGTEDGRMGGWPGGTADGVPNGTGTGPVSDYDAPPRVVRQTRPRYPPQAFVQKVQGTVVLEIVIDPSGHVSRTRVIQSIPLLDAAARDAVDGWLFQPALKRGRPVPALAFAPVHFRLY